MFFQNPWKGDRLVSESLQVSMFQSIYNVTTKKWKNNKSFHNASNALDTFLSKKYEQWL